MSLLRAHLGALIHQDPNVATSRSQRRRLRLERLEPRLLLTASPVAADWLFELPYAYGADGAELHDSAVDPAGNVVVLGEFTGTVDFDPSSSTHQLTSTFSSDLFVAKYDVDGGLIDAVDVGDFQIRSNGYPSIAIDDTGSVYITCGYDGQVQLMGGHTLPAPAGNDEAALFAKFDSTLQTIEWASHATLSAWGGFSRGGIDVQNMAVDGTGNGLYFSGIQVGQGQFGSVSVQQEYDGFVSRIEADTGAFAWVKTLKNGGRAVVAVDPTDATAVYARESSTLMRLSAAGDSVWETTFSDNVFWGDIDAHSGGIYMGGSFSGEAVLGPSTIVAAGERDALAARFDAATGDVVWATRAGGADDDRATGVSIDSNGNLFLAGAFEDIADFGNDTLAERTPHDKFFSQLDGSTGEFLQRWRFASHSYYSVGLSGRDGVAYTFGVFDAANADFPLGDVPAATSGLFNHVMRFEPAADATIPRINGFVATPDPAEQDSPIALSVVGMHDPDSRVESVAFYHDVDNDRRLNVSVDTLLGTDSTGVDGWGIDAATTALPLGDVQFLAQATYDSSSLSLAAGATTFLRLPSSTYVSSDVGQTIRDLKTVTSSLNVPDSFVLGDVDVTLTITHRFNRDLDVFLIHPDGTRVELFTDVGGPVAGNENFIGTTLDDQADDTLDYGGAPFTGVFRPEGILSDLNGKDAAGVWTLEITDDARGDRGTLEAWSLTLAPQTPIAPTLAVDDVTVVEGDSGVALAEFTVIRSGDTSQAVSVDYSTADGTASAGSDYTHTSGTLNFAVGETTKTVTISVQGDVDVEPDEEFFVDLSNPVGGTINDPQGTATIVDDDAIAELGTLYIYDIRFDSKRGGKDYRAVVEIRREADDAAVAGVTVKVDFAGTTYTLETNSNGIARTSWERNLAAGDYYLDAYEVALAGYEWNPFTLDLEDDSDDDGKADDLLVV